jgi:hypothetical protein
MLLGQGLGRIRGPSVQGEGCWRDRVWRSPAPTDGTVKAKPPTPLKPAPAPSPTPRPTPTPSSLDALVDKAYAGKAAAELASAPVDALNGVTAADAQALHAALGIRTIADLATNRYIRAAQEILNTPQPPRGGMG